MRRRRGGIHTTVGDYGEDELTLRLRHAPAARLVLAAHGLATTEASVDASAPAFLLRRTDKALLGPAVRVPASPPGETERSERQDSSVTRHVTRHGSAGPDDEAYARSLSEGLLRTIGTLERSPGMFDSALGKSLLNARAHLAIDPDASELSTWEAVVTALQTHSSLFATAGKSEERVLCRIAGADRSIRTTGPTRSVNPGHWINAFWLAIVCRDQTRMSQLSGVSLELLRASRARYDEFMSDWVDTLQPYWDKRPASQGNSSPPSKARILTSRRWRKKISSTRFSINR